MSVHESSNAEKEHLDDDRLDEELAIKPTQTAQTAHHDVVFGEITDEGPNYRNVHSVPCLYSVFKPS